MTGSGDSLTAEQLSFQAGGGGAIPTSPLQLNIRPITTAKTGALFYGEHHYLGAQSYLAQFEFGAYFAGELLGMISFGPISAMETLKTIGAETRHPSEFFEIKRLAFVDACPKNSESRLIGVSVRLLKKLIAAGGGCLSAIITYADTNQGHTGTIYKASNFQYLGLTKQKNDYKVVEGSILQRGVISGKARRKKESGDPCLGLDVAKVDSARVEGQWRKKPQAHVYIMESQRMLDGTEERVMNWKDQLRELLDRYPFPVGVTNEEETLWRRKIGAMLFAACPPMAVAYKDMFQNRHHAFTVGFEDYCVSRVGEALLSDDAPYCENIARSIRDILNGKEGSGGNGNGKQPGTRIGSYKSLVEERFHGSLKRSMPELLWENNAAIAGTRIEPDFTCRVLSVAVDLDSWMHHRDRGEFVRDRRNNRLLQALGWMHLRYPDDEYNDPKSEERVIQDIKRICQGRPGYPCQPTS